MHRLHTKASASRTRLRTRLWKLRAVNVPYRPERVLRTETPPECIFQLGFVANSSSIQVHVVVEMATFRSVYEGHPRRQMRSHSQYWNSTQTLTTIVPQRACRLCCDYATNGPAGPRHRPVLVCTACLVAETREPIYPHYNNPLE